MTWQTRRLVVVAAAMVVACVCAVFDRRALLHGVAIWLIAGSAISCGSLAWLAIHALTGGRWGDAAREPFLGMAQLIPYVAIPALVLLAFGSTVYPWMADASATPQDVMHLYLNRPSVALRTAIVFAVLWHFALAARRSPLTRGAAAVCLIVYAIGMNMFAIDFVASIDPHYTSSAIGVQIIFLQLTAALCASVLLLPSEQSGEAVDLGGLLLACMLGESYIIYMTYLIHWYGNQPDTVHYYLVRDAGHWHAMNIVTIVLWLGTTLLLLMSGVRTTPALLRGTAALALAFVFLVVAWLIAPAAGDVFSAGGMAVLVGIACLVASGALASLIRPSTMLRASPEVEHV